jgi:predicted permease
MKYVMTKKRLINGTIIAIVAIWILLGYFLFNTSLLRDDLDIALSTSINVTKAPPEKVLEIRKEVNQLNSQITFLKAMIYFVTPTTLVLFILLKTSDRLKKNRKNRFQ